MPDVDATAIEHKTTHTNFVASRRALVRKVFHGGFLLVTADVLNLGLHILHVINADSLQVGGVVLGTVEEAVSQIGSSSSTAMIVDCGRGLWTGDLPHDVKKTSGRQSHHEIAESHKGEQECGLGDEHFDGGRVEYLRCREPSEPVVQGQRAIIGSE